MRLDKWLKSTRLIKRRVVAQMACEQGRVYLNDRPVKPAAEIKVGDQIHIELGAQAVTVEVLLDTVSKDVNSMYQVIAEIRRTKTDTSS